MSWSQGDRIEPKTAVSNSNSQERGLDICAADATHGRASLDRASGEVAQGKQENASPISSLHNNISPPGLRRSQAGVTAVSSAAPASSACEIDVSACGLRNNTGVSLASDNPNLIGDNGESGIADGEIILAPLGTSPPAYTDPPAWTPSILPPLYSPPKAVKKVIRVKVVYNQATLTQDARARAALQHAREMQQLQRHSAGRHHVPKVVYNQATLTQDAKERAALQHAREMQQLQRHSAGRHHLPIDSSSYVV